MDKLSAFGDINIADAFSYLDELRESGRTNMFGAAPYLSDEYGYDKADARTILSAWMKSDRDLDMAARVKAARSAH